MRSPRSLQWRIALSSGGLVFACMLVASILISLLASQFPNNMTAVLIIVSLCGLAATFSVLGLAYLVGNRTSNYIRQVTEGARRLSQGDLEHRVYAPWEDETWELAATFNTMAGTLKTSFQELAAERNKLSAILETMADGVVMIAPAGEIVLLNQVARNLLNVHTSDFLGRRFIEVARNIEIQSLVTRSIETEQPQYEELELSQGRFVSAIAIPLRDNPPSNGVILTLNDLTRIRQVDITRKEFVSNVSHEFRSPLASIKAVVETLESGALAEPETAKDFLSRIHRDTDRMISMADHLLELSRLESGQMPLHLYPMELEPLLEDVRNSCSEWADAKGITLLVVPAEGLPPVMADEENLRRVLVNLLDNAIKFTPEGGDISVLAGIRQSVVEVRVKNTGAGIPREHLPHVFERFYKVDRSRHDSGTGLGLAIVKHMVQLHGGEVAAESQEGQGATFSFTIPSAS